MTPRFLFLMVVAASLCLSPVTVAGESLSVCIVAEQPSWSYRYLVDMLTRDAEFDASSMLLDGRAALAPELKKCAVLILVDVSPQAMREQAEIVEPIADFVAGGGGLIVTLNKSWTGEEFPLQKLLPVQIAAGNLEANDAPRLSRPSITGDGLRSPILRLVDDPMKNQQLWREELDACFHEPLPVAAHREASVLAIDPLRRLDGEEIPLIATREVGAGRVIFLNNCQTWRWRVKPVGNYHGRFWKQTTRFAADE